MEQTQLINTAFLMFITVLVFAVVRSNSVMVNSKLLLKFLAIKFSNAKNGLQDYNLVSKISLPKTSKFKKICSQTVLTGCTGKKYWYLMPYESNHCEWKDLWKVGHWVINWPKFWILHAFLYLVTNFQLSWQAVVVAE